MQHPSSITIQHPSLSLTKQSVSLHIKVFDMYLFNYYTDYT